MLITLRTDHHSLRWIIGLADYSGRLAMRRLRFVDLDYDIQYRTDRKHNVADAMSKIATNVLENRTVDEDIPCYLVETAKFKAE